MTAESLNLRVERAWLALQNIGGERALYMSHGCFSLRWHRTCEPCPRGMERVGTYRPSVSLLTLRQAVFSAYERAWRASGRR